MIINTTNANLLPTQKSFSNSRSSFHGCCVFNFITSTNTNTTSHAKPPKSRVLVRASAADNGGKGRYKRIPMDTAGAYQLIDEESGQKVIVWGGCGDDDDDDATVPSKDVLSWTPTEKKSISALKKTSFDEGSEVVSAASRSDSPTIRASGGLGRNFGRLKMQRVRVLANKTSSSIEQKERNDYDDNLVVKKKKSPRIIYDSDSNSGREYMPKNVKKVHDHRLQDREPKVNLFNEFNEDTNSKVWLRKDMDHPGDTSGKHTEQLQQYSAEARTYENKLPASVSKKSAAFFSKWGDGESTHSFRTEAMGSQLRMRKPSTENGFFSRKSFIDVGCSDYMIESLRGQGFLRPSHIQAMAFAHVVEGKSCIISDQSGSGKTLAYLVPVIQRLRQEELQGVSKSISKSPRVIILVPTAELASQVLSNCRSISKSGVPFRSMVVTGGFKQKTQLESLQQELDVLIATPGRFLFLLKERFLHLKNIRCVVLDEVDILVRDEDFDQALQSFINSSPVTTQYLFVTATLPTDAYNKLVEVFPDCEAIMGPSMHRTSIGLEEVLVDCSGDYEAEKNPETAFLNKKNALLRLVEGSSVSKTIIFCNKIETCRKVENILTRYDRKGYHMRVLSFHAALTQQSRLANMTEFLKSHSEKEALFLICTDRASRGIDFTGVDHVILFDFPRDPSEYVRRVGRTARGAGGKGTAYVFVVGKQVSLARRIMERNQKGQPLHDVPCMY